MKSVKFCLLLTSAIDPSGVSFMGRSDPKQRLDDTKDTMRKWLSYDNNLKIIFCDNSNFDLTAIKNLLLEEKAEHRVELISFPGQDFDRKLGKGYGEIGCIKYVLAQSHFAKDCDFLIKVNARYFISNFRLIARSLSRSQPDVSCDMRKYGTYCDARFIWFNKEFFTNYFIPRRENIDDSKGVYFEHELAKAVHQAMGDGMNWLPLKYAPRINGFSGTSNVKLDIGFRFYLRNVFYKIKDLVMGA